MTDDLEPRLLTVQPFVPICAIGASAGGVTALQALFQRMATDLGLAFVVIVHLSPDHPSALAEILSTCTTMPVLQITDGPTLKPNCVYVIAPDSELVIDGDSVTARPFSEPRGRRAPVDVFFRSVAAARGGGIAIVLSGSGADGTLGVRAIKEAGGVVMAQDPSEAGFGSMPQNAVATGAADFVAPVARLAERVAEVARSKDAVRSLDMDGVANDLRRIVSFLRARTGHDFSSYKRATVIRRVLRRMQVCRTDTLAAYADHLYVTPEEAKELFADLLISVTSFFRDPSSFEALDRLAIRPLFDGVDPDRKDGIRMWVVGCATGEEAYSIGMVLLEEMDRRRTSVPLQIFATDLDEGALATAREGRYPRTIEADVSDERLSRFFIDEGTHYRVRKELREAVLFASHSVLKEPPFRRLDLISCRNLLIYMERSLQHQVSALFHYGLKSGGILFLGSAETMDSAAELFSTLDRDARLYVARPKTGHSLPVLAQFAPADRFLVPGQITAVPTRPEQASLSASMHVAALEQGAPPSALVDESHTILHLSPTAGRFIFHSAGPVSNVLPAVVRPELRLDLKFALNRAIEQRLPTLTHQAEVAFDGDTRRIAMHVVPVRRDERRGIQALVSFLDAGLVAEDGRAVFETGVRSDEVRRLHAELKAAQEALVASRHAHEVSVQDQRAANEELQSMNEEYRSTSEELETSKEELQSINEELHTVNAQMKSRLDTVSAAHSDLLNLTASTEVGTLFLTGDLRIKMFTPPIADLFNVTDVDVGRIITDFTHHLAYDELDKDVHRVLANLVPVEREVMSRGGNWYVMRIRPYRTVENRIDGTVVSFVDISDRLRAEKALMRSERQLRALVGASSQVLYRMSPDWSRMHEILGGGILFPSDRPDVDWIDTTIPEDERQRVRSVIRHALEAKIAFDLEHKAHMADGTVGWVQSRAVAVLDEAGIITEWFGSASDVTQRRRAEDALRDSEERLRVLIEGVPQFVWRAAEGGDWTWSSPQWSAYTGLTEADSRGSGWLAALHPDDRERARAAWPSTAKVAPFDVEMRIREASTGTYRSFQARAVPVKGDGGAVVEWLGTSTDVDDLRKLRERQAILVAELQHRTRNLLGVVKATASTILRSSRGLDDFASDFQDRLGALARVQGLLSRLSEGEQVTFDDLIRTELSAVGAPKDDPARVLLDGPTDVFLRSRTVQTFALALHELATNATKYGALKHADGRLEVTWRLAAQNGEEERWLHVDWSESGVPMPSDASSPQGSGAGRVLIEQALPYELGAKTSFVMAPDGVRCSISLPVSNRTSV